MADGRQQSVSRRLLQVVALTGTVSVLLAGAGIVVSDLFLYRRAIDRDLWALADVLAQSISPALAFDDPETARQTLWSLESRSHIRAACLYANDGRLFAFYVRDPQTDGCPPTPAAAPSNPGPTRAAILHPVQVKGQSLGNLYLLYDLGEVYIRARVFGSVVFALLAVSGLLALLLTGRLRRMVTDPIVRLAGTARDVTDTGDYGLRAEKHSSDEIGELVQSFNGMLMRIQERDAELHRAKNELETRVHERTAELRNRTAELERSNAELEQFAYIASHDLQEPLRMVTMYMQLLEEEYRGKLGPEADEFIHYAIEGSQRMKQLIADLLTYSRAGSTALRLSEVDAGEVAAEALRNLEAAVRESEAVVEIGDLPRLEADRTQMLQLFQNLLSNAIKFRRGRPRVEVSAVRQGNGWLFAVRDNGIGIPKAYWERIFLVFQRLHGRMEYPGTGIGLAVCTRVIERHGGRIWVESREGEGSSFFFIIPVQQPGIH